MSRAAKPNLASSTNGSSGFRTPHSALRTRRLLAALFPVACSLFPVSAGAETITWTGGAGTSSWHTAANWDLNRVPATGDDVVIPAVGASADVRYTDGSSTSINSLTSDKAFMLTSGTLDIAAASVINAAFGMTGGTLGGSGLVTFSGTDNTWSNGMMSGSGSTRVALGATLTLLPASNHYLGRTLENLGSINWNGGDTICDGGTVQNRAGAQFTFNPDSDRLWRSSSGTNTFLNEGTLTKAGSSTATFSVPGGTPSFTNAAGGVIQVTGGTLSIGWPGTNDGTFAVNAGQLTLGDSWTHTAGSAVNGPGTLAFTGGSSTLAGSTNGTAFLSITGGTAEFNSDHAFARLTLTGGTLGGSGLVTFSGTDNTWSNGMMSGSGSTRVALGATLTLLPASNHYLGRTLENLGSINWNGGDTICDGGTVQNRAGAQFTFNPDSDRLWRSSSGTNTFLNEGTLTKAGSSTATFSVPGGTPSFTNAAGGVIQVTGGTLSIGWPGTNDGTFAVNAGQLTLGDSWTHTAGSAVNGPGTLAFTGGSSTLAGSTNGTAFLSITGGTAEFNSDHAFARLTLTGGTLGGSGLVTFSGTDNTWSNGMMSGSGSTRVALGATLTLLPASNHYLGRTLENLGSINWNGGDTICDGGTVQNRAGAQFTFNPDSDRLWRSSSGTNTFLNEGTLTKAGSSTATFSVPGGTPSFTNAAGGVIQVTGGTLSIGWPGTNDGTFAVNAGQLTLGDSWTHTAGSAVNGPGTLAFTGGSSTLAGSTNGTAFLSITGGTAEFNSDHAFARLTLTGGTLGGSGLVTFSGTDNTWSNGMMSGSGSTRVALGATLTLLPASNHYLGRTLENLGSINWNGGDTICDGGTVQNRAGAQFTFNPDSDRLWRSSSGTNTFLNEGTLTKAGSSTATFSVPGGTPSFTNAAGGVIQVTGGTLVVAWNVTNVSGTTLTGGTWNVGATLRLQSANIVTNRSALLLNGPASSITNESSVDALANFATNATAGSFRLEAGRNFSRPAATFANSGNLMVGTGCTFDVATLNLTGGVLGGDGTVNANVNNTGGTVAAGFSPGQLDIVGNYTQSAGGEFEVEIAGTAPGTEYDQVTVSGTASLDGSLNVVMLGGFQPDVGETFDILTAGSVVGEFADHNLPLNFGGICKGASAYFADAVQLEALDSTVVITDQPEGATLCEGEPVTFAVAATGTSLSYQWRLDGDDIDGATGTSYSISSTVADDSGVYDCVISNPCGDMFSEEAELVVQTEAAITLQPVSQAKCINTSVTFSVTATGTPAPTYQWRKGGVDLSGETGSSLTLDPLALSDAGSYDVVVTNECAEVTSAAATLVVDDVPVITVQPASQTGCSGGQVTLSVTATGSLVPSYQWRKGGQPIAGAVLSTLTFNPVAPANAGSYDVVVTNACGDVTSTAASLTVNMPVSITVQPQSQGVCIGSPATFSVTATGSPAPTYQWQKNAVDLPGATGSSYTINSVSSGDNATYRVRVTNTCGTVTSASATLTVQLPPTLSPNGQPAPVTVCPGQVASFEVFGNGGGNGNGGGGGNQTPAYQWRRNGAPIPDGAGISGATSPRLMIQSTTASHAGNYDCVITNPCGSVTTNTAALTVLAATTITQQPVSQSVAACSPATFSVAATGQGSLTYKWTRNGTLVVDGPQPDGSVISGATTPTLTIDPAGMGSAGNYVALVQGQCGPPVPSNSATLTIAFPPPPWSALGSSFFHANVLSVIEYNGELIVGGAFPGGIARWNGSNWVPLGGGLSSATIFALKVYNGDLIAGGRMPGGVTKWNGSAWAPLQTGVSLPSGSGIVKALVVYNGDLIVGGGFEHAGAQPASNVARWNGSAWAPLGAGTSNEVSALAVFGPELVAGGLFTTAGSQPASYVARWNGSTWAALGSGMNNRVTDLTVFEGELIAAGAFGTAGGATVRRVARWNGSTWSALGDGTNNLVIALEVFDGALIAGGAFTTAGGQSANYIAQWNGASWKPLGTGTNDYVQELGLFGNALVAAGSFSSAGGQPASRIARWSTPPEDADADGICDAVDNCPSQFNPFQANADGDAAGDACDRCPIGNENQDSDHDGVPDACDNCPSASNPGTLSFVGGMGQWTQPDRDGDGDGDRCDNCPGEPNPDQADADSDGFGDACDRCDATFDTDNDGIENAVDTQPATQSPDFSDGNTSGRIVSIPSGTTVCVQAARVRAGPAISVTVSGVTSTRVTVSTNTSRGTISLGNGNQTIRRGSLETYSFGGDMQIEFDIAGEMHTIIPGPDGTIVFHENVENDELLGVFVAPYDDVAEIDGLPLVPGQATAIGDAIPPDTDGDTVPDHLDVCPLLAGGSQSDTDLDLIGDACDNCPSAFNQFQDDADGDGIGDACDVCQLNSNGGQADADADGLGDACDACPLPIAFSQSPTDQAVVDGGTAVFTASGTGNGSESYQWRFSGTDLSDGPAAGGGTVSGSTTDTLTIAGAAPEDMGLYDVVVTDSCTTAASTVATLTVAGVPSAALTGAVTRKACDLPVTSLNGAGPRSSEPRQGGITELRLAFNVPPAGPDTNSVTLEEATCAEPEFVPYGGASTVSAVRAGNDLVLTFTPGLENARTYRLTLGPSVTSIPGQTVEVRGLVGDATGDGLVNSADRSAIVGIWTGSGFSCGTDINNSGQTNAGDRSAVVGAWTNPAGNCAP